MPTPLTPKYHPTPEPLTDAERDIFTRARALIDTPDKHFQFAHAISNTNRLVDPTDPTACRFCGIGAAMAAAGCRVEHDTTARMLIWRLNLLTEIVMDDDRILFTAVNDGMIGNPQFPEDMRDLTLHQRVLYIYDRILA